MTEAPNCASNALITVEVLVQNPSSPDGESSLPLPSATYDTRDSTEDESEGFILLSMMGDSCYHRNSTLMFQISSYDYTQTEYAICTIKDKDEGVPDNIDVN